MQVEAIREGYYNHRRVYKGQRFDLFKETDFSKAWMKRLDGREPPVEVKPQVEEPAAPQADEPESDDVI